VEGLWAAVGEAGTAGALPGCHCLLQFPCTCKLIALAVFCYHYCCFKVPVLTCGLGLTSSTSSVAATVLAEDEGKGRGRIPSPPQVFGCSNRIMYNQVEVPIAPPTPHIYTHNRHPGTLLLKKH
jgi:hypothetical protein